jgi:hypothetical protein
VKRLVLILAGAAALSGCSVQPAETVSGTLAISLSSPFVDDGALLLTLSGGPVDSVETTGYTLYSSRLDANTLEMIVTGQLTSGTIARVHIADERLAPQYSVKVLQAAAQSSYTQRDPSAYGVTLAP